MFKWRGYRSDSPYGYRWSVKNSHYSEHISELVSSWRVKPSEPHKFALLQFSEHFSRNFCTSIDGVFEFKTLPESLLSYGAPILKWVSEEDDVLSSFDQKIQHKLTSLKKIWSELRGDIDLSLRHAALKYTDDKVLRQLIEAVYHLPGFCACIEDLERSLNQSCELGSRSSESSSTVSEVSAEFSSASFIAMRSFNHFTCQITLDFWSLLSDNVSLLKSFVEKSKWVGVYCSLSVTAIIQNSLACLMHSNSSSTSRVSKSQASVLVDVWSILSKLSRNAPQLFSVKPSDVNSFSFYPSSPMALVLITLAILASICKVNMLSYLDEGIFEEDFVLQTNISQQLYHVSLSFGQTLESCNDKSSMNSICTQLDNFSFPKRNSNSQSLLSQILGFSSEGSSENIAHLSKRRRIEQDLPVSSTSGQRVRCLGQLLRQDYTRDDDNHNDDVDDDNWLFSTKGVEAGFDIVHPGIVRQRDTRNEDVLQSDNTEELQVLPSSDLLCLIPLLSGFENSDFLVRCWLPVLISIKSKNAKHFNDQPFEVYFFKRILNLCLGSKGLSDSLSYRQEAYSLVSHTANLVSIFITCMSLDEEFKSYIIQKFENIIRGLLLNANNEELSWRDQVYLSTPLLGVVKRVAFFQSKANITAQELFSWWPLGPLLKSKTEKLGISDSHGHQSSLNSFVGEMANMSTSLSIIAALIDSLFSLAEACGSSSQLHLIPELIARFEMSLHSSTQASKESIELLSDRFDVEVNTPAESKSGGEGPKSFGEIFKEPVRINRSKPLDYDPREINLSWGAAKCYHGSSEKQTNESIIYDLVSEDIGKRDGKTVDNPLKSGLSQIIWLNKDSFSESGSQTSIPDEKLCEIVINMPGLETVALDILSICLFYLEVYCDRSFQNTRLNLLKKIWSSILCVSMDQFGDGIGILASNVTAGSLSEMARVRSPIWLCRVLLPFMLRTSLLSILVPHLRDRSAFPVSFQIVLTILRIVRGEFTRSRICSRQSYSRHISAHNAVSQLFLSKPSTSLQSNSAVYEHYEAQRKRAVSALRSRRHILRKSLLRSRAAFISLRLCGFAITSCLNPESIIDHDISSQFVEPIGYDNMFRWLAYANCALGIGRSLRHLAASFLRQIYNHQHDMFDRRKSEKQQTISLTSKMSKHDEGMKDLESLARFELRVLNDTIPAAEILFSKRSPGQETLLTLWSWVAQPILPVVIASARGYSAVQAAFGTAESAGIVAMAIRFTSRCTCLQVATGLTSWKDVLNTWSPYPLETPTNFADNWTLGNQKCNKSKLCEGESQIVCDYLISISDITSVISDHDRSIYQTAIPSIALDVLLDYSLAFASAECKTLSDVVAKQTEETVVYLGLDHKLVSTVTTQRKTSKDSILTMPSSFLFSEPSLTKDSNQVTKPVLLSLKQMSKYSSLIRSMSIVFLMGITSELSLIQKEVSYEMCVLDMDATSLFLIQIFACLADCITPSLALSQLVKFVIHQLSLSDKQNDKKRSIALENMSEFLCFQEFPDLSVVGSSIEARLSLLKLLVKATPSARYSWVLAAAAPISLDLLINETSSTFHHSQTPTAAALTALQIINIFSPLSVSAICANRDNTLFSLQIQDLAKNAWAFQTSHLLGLRAEQYKHSFSGDPMPPLLLSAFAKQLSKQDLNVELGPGESQWLKTWSSMLNDLASATLKHCTVERAHGCKRLMTNILEACNQALNPLDELLFSDIDTVLTYPPYVFKVVQNWLLYGRATTADRIETKSSGQEELAGICRLLFVSSTLLPHLMQGHGLFKAIRIVSLLSKVIDDSDVLLLDLPSILQMISIPISRLLPIAFKSEGQQRFRLLMSEMQGLVHSILRNILRGRVRIPDGSDLSTSDSSTNTIYPVPQQRVFVPLLSNELVHVISLWSIIDLLKEGTNASTKGISTVIGDYVDSFSFARSVSSKIPSFIEFTSHLCHRIASSETIDESDSISDFSDFTPMKRDGVDATDWLNDACDKLWRKSMSLLSKTRSVYDFDDAVLSLEPYRNNMRHGNVWNMSTLALDFTSFIVDMNCTNLNSSELTLSEYWKNARVISDQSNYNLLNMPKKATVRSPALISLHILQCVLLLIPLSIESSLHMRVRHKSLETSENTCVNIEDCITKQELEVHSQADLPMLVPLSQLCCSSEEAKESMDTTNPNIIDLTACTDIQMSVTSSSQRNPKKDSVAKRVSFAESEDVIDILDIVDGSELPDNSNSLRETFHLRSFKGINFDQYDLFERGVRDEHSSEPETCGLTNESLWECIVKAKCNNNVEGFSSNLESRYSTYVSSSIWRLPSLLPSYSMKDKPSTYSNFEKPSLMTSSLVLLRNLRWFLERALKFAQKTASSQYDQLLEIQQGFNDLVVEVVDTFLFDTVCTGDRFLTSSMWGLWKCRLSHIRERLLQHLLLLSQKQNENINLSLSLSRQGHLKTELVKYE